MYHCRCIACGPTFESEEHCEDSICPDCGRRLSKRIYLTKPKKKFKPRNTIKKKIKKTLDLPTVLSGFSLMFLNMVRYGVLTWLFTYYVFSGNFAIADFGTVSLKTIFIPIAGVLGTLIYNKFPTKKELTSILFLALMGVTWFVFPFTTGLLATFLVLLSSAFLYGPHVFLVTTFPSRLHKDKVVAAATGFIDGMGYIGIALVMLLVPYLVLETAGGWNNVFFLCCSCAFVASLTVALTHCITKRRERSRSC
jgi:sugar phosphate permease